MRIFDLGEPSTASIEILADEKDNLPEMLVELYDLHLDDKGGDWQETARWIRYEEDVEGVDHHWGRPHVAFLSFHSLIQIRKALLNGALLLNLEADNFTEVCREMVQAMKMTFDIEESKARAILRILDRQHKHVPEPRNVLKKMSTFRKPSRIFTIAELETVGEEDEGDRKSSIQSQKPPPRSKSFAAEPSFQLNLREVSSHGTISDNNTLTLTARTPQDPPPRRKTFFGRIPSFVGTSASSASLDVQELLKKLPENAEACQVLVGTLPEMKETRFAMVRLAQTRLLPELLEAPVPMRFIFLILGPKIFDVDYHEMGRSVATLMANSNFHEMAYMAQNREELIAGIDQFLDDSIVIPPGRIDSNDLLSVADIKKALAYRRRRHRRKSKWKKRAEIQKTF